MDCNPPGTTIVKEEAMEQKNPFKVLGFQPDLLRGLSDSEILTLVKSQYRALMQIFHPDVSSRKNSTTRSVAINGAYKELCPETSSPEIFNLWKDAFLRPRKDALSQIEPKLQAAKDQNATLAETLENSVLQFAQTVAKPRLELPKTEDLPIPRFLVTRLRPGKLLVADTMLDLLTILQGGNKEASGRSYLEITVANDGSLSKRKCLFRLVKKSEPLPSDSSTWVTRRNDVGLADSWIPTGNVVSLPPDMRLVGALMLGDSERAVLPVKRDLGRKLLAGVDLGRRFAPEEAFSLEIFRPFLRVLKPVIVRGEIVVAISGHVDNPMFKVIGQVILWKY